MLFHILIPLTVPVPQIGLCFFLLNDNKISDIATYSSSNIVFVIGGSLGLSTSVKALAHDVISFSKLTFPHQLIRVFLLEQLFRSFKINNNETYHHE